MFSHLVESDLHRGELKRKGTFFLATMAAYALVVMAMGVVGVYAYEARIDDQQLELVALVPPETEAPKPPEAPPKVRAATPDSAANNGGSRSAGAPRAQLVPSNTSPDPTKIDGPPQAFTTQMPPTITEGGNRSTGFSTGPYNPNGDGSNTPSNATGKPNGKVIDEEPPPIAKKAQPPAKQRIPYIGPVNSLALSLPQPTYPAVAKIARAQGPVTVEIVIDETGRVITAHATSGHPLLRSESEKAAYRARFSPTLLQNQPVKAKGVITFNFILNK